MNPNMLCYRLFEIGGCKSPLFLLPLSHEITLTYFPWFAHGEL
jgi:hypothetical protein